MRPTPAQRLRYHLDSIFARGSAAQFLLLGLLTVVVLVFGMTAYFFGLFSANSDDVEGIRRGIDGGFWDALWWSAKHVVDPAAFDADYGAGLAVVVIAAVISVLGMVIFGIFIGFISAAVEARLALLNNGWGRVIESDHVLILGWSHTIYPVIDMLGRVAPRHKVVVLAENDVQEMRRLITVHWPHRAKTRAILRRGSPRSLVELERVAFDRAFSIIVLADEAGANADDQSDTGVIKMLMLLAAHAWDDHRPKMVAEITKSENVEVAQIAGKHRVPVVCSSEVIGKIIVQTSRQPGLATVYREIFSGTGSQIYVQGFPECAGRRFEDLIYGFDGAIPLGVSRARREDDGFTTFVPRLNPGPDHVIGSDEWIILLAQRERNRFDSSEKPDGLATDLPPVEPPRQLENILILGFNRSLYNMLQEFDKYVPRGGRVQVVAGYAQEIVESLLAERIPQPFQNIQFTYRQKNYVNRAVLEGLLADAPSCTVVLADDSSGESEADARVIMTLVLLSEIRRGAADGAGAVAGNVVAEVTNPQNRELLYHTSVQDVIASAEFTSWLIVQISQQQMLRLVYADLLDARGHEIYLKPATRYLAADVPCTFGDVLRQGRRVQETAIGVVLARDDRGAAHGEHGFDVRINPPRDERFTFTPRDKVIMLAEDQYAEPAARAQSSDRMVGQ